MKKIKIKIQKYEEDNRNLLVSVASDETKSSNPDDYVSVCYQPFSMWPEELDNEKILRNLAYACIYVADQTKLHENFSEEDERIEYFKSISGKTFEFDVEELVKSFKE